MAQRHRQAGNKGKATATVDPSTEDAALLTTAEVAELLKVSPRTLKQWRHEQRGPKYYVLGPRAVRYKRADLIRWQQRFRIDPLRP
jgi:excisionase family DNA binding protein